MLRNFPLFAQNLSPLNHLSKPLDDVINESFHLIGS